MKKRPAHKTQKEEIAELRSRLSEAQDLLASIQSGAVDAFITEDQKIFTLQGADQTYRVLVETIAEGALTLTFDGTIMYCNSRLAEIFGVKSETLVGSSFFKYVPQVHISKWQVFLNESRDKTLRTEMQIQRKNGSLLPVLISCRSLKLAAETHLCMIITDISEQKKTTLELEKHHHHLEQIVQERTKKLQDLTQALKSSESQLLNVIDSSPVGIAIFDLKGKIKQVNKSMLQITGYAEKKELIERDLPSLIRQEFRQKILLIWQEVLITKSVRDVEVIGLKKNANEIQALLSFTRLDDASSKPYAVLVMIQDITSRKQAEASLRKSEERLRLVTDAAEIGYWDWAITENRMEWSFLCKLLFEIPEDETISYARFLEAVHLDDRDRVNETIKRTLEKEAAKDLEIDYRITLRDGKVRWVHTKGRVIFDKRGTPVRMAGIAMDITTRKSLEAKVSLANQKLEEVNKRKSDYVAMVSHELKNPLAITKESIAMLEDGMAGPVNEEEREILETGKRSTERLIRLVTDLLDLEKIEAGRMELNRKEFDLAFLVNEVANDFQTELFKKHIRFERNIQPKIELFGATGTGWRRW